MKHKMTGSRALFVGYVMVLSVIGCAVAANTSANERALLEEITVTAQKREQNINEVPVAILAFGSDELHRYDVTKPEDIKFLVPGLDISNRVEAAGISVSLRGLSINTFTATSDPAVAVYLDEMYLASLSQIAFQSFDMEAVEVLKGPQGTLFGRNTPGGLIHFKTNKPNREFAARTEVEVGSYGNYALEGVLNAPVTEHTSVRLSVRGSLFDGYFENRLDGNNNTGGTDSISTRGQLLYEPNENSSIHFTAHYDHFKGSVTPFYSLGLNDPEGGLCQPFLDLTGGGNGARLEKAINASIARGCSDFTGFSEPDTDPFKVGVDSTFGADGIRRGDAFGFRLNMNFDISADIALTSITTYEYDDQFWEAIQFSPAAGVADLPQASDVNALTQEIRLAGAVDNRLDWVLGGFVSYDNIGFDIIESLVFFLPYSLFSKQQTLSAALFANVDWHLNSQWTLTAGLRGTHEERDIVVSVSDFNSGLIPAPFRVEEKVNIEDLSGKVGLSYKPNDDWLLYASFSKGFKSPGFNTAFVTNKFEVGPADAEELYALEGGVKATLLDGRVQTNLSAFHYKRKNAQGVDFVVNVGGIPFQGLTNIGDAELSGMELDVQWRPTDSLSFAGGLSWIDTRVLNGILEGNDLIGAPDYSVTLMGRYDWNLGGGWIFSPQIDTRFIDERHQFPSNSLPVTGVYEVVADITDEQFAYWQVNAGFELASPDEQWTFSGKVFNILDEVEYIPYFFFNELTILPNGEPRTFKLSFSYRW